MKTDSNPQGEHVPIICDTCWWKHPGAVSCDAFPKGIPIPIILGVFDHRARYITREADDKGLTYKRNPDA